MASIAATLPAEPGARPQNADLTAWLAVMAGTLGALMATLDVSIVNSALPTIQGEIGATPSEGTWVATSFLVAEIVIIPLCAWLERVIGLRTFLLIAAGLFTAFSVLCGTAGDLTTMIIGRAGQGLTGGALLPTAMTIIATRLPPHQQPIGTALFGVTVVMGPVFGPLLGGWLTETISWHYAFLINVPICALLMLLLALGLPHQKAKLWLLAEADWLGVAGLALGLGGITVILEEGHREQWFSSDLIIQLTMVTVVGFVMIIVGQLTAKDPVIRLSLLFDRVFGSVAIMALALGMVLYGTTYLIPQFVAAVSGYNALQAGQIVMISGLPMLVLMPLSPLLLRHIDVRVAVALGLSILALSCYIETSLSIWSDGDAFVDSQIMRGVGMVFSFVFLNQAAISSVPSKYAGDVAGIFNAARNIGGSIALAAIASIQDQRLWFHSRRIEESLSASIPMVQDRLNEMTAMLGGAEAALRMLSGEVMRQALVMTFNDMFWLMAVGSACVAPLALLLRPLPKNLTRGPIH